MTTKKETRWEIVLIVVDVSNLGSILLTMHLSTLYHINTTVQWVCCVQDDDEYDEDADPDYKPKEVRTDC